jgi:hypothetical protein
LERPEVASLDTTLNTVHFINMFRFQNFVIQIREPKVRKQLTKGMGSGSGI